MAKAKYLYEVTAASASGEKFHCRAEASSPREAIKEIRHSEVIPDVIPQAMGWKWTAKRILQMG